MTRFVRVTIVAGCIAVLSVVCQSHGGEPSKPAPAPSAPDFAGKALMIYVKDPQQGGVLSDVRVRQIGDRKFISGKVVMGENSPEEWENVIQWIPVDEVTGILEFKSTEAALKAHATWGKQRAKKGDD